MPTDHVQPPYRLTAATPRPHHETAALADQLLSDWLKSEGREEPAPRARQTPAERLRLGDRVLLDRDDGPLPGRGPGARYSRRRLRTPAVQPGTDQLTLTLASDTADGPTRLRIEAEHLPAGATAVPPGRTPVPDLVRHLLPLLDAAEGPVPLTVAPRLLAPADLDGLIDELCDPERTLPTVVASVPPAVPVEQWQHQVLDPLLRQLPGLASLYVLGHGALPRFNLALEYHKVYGGAVRTFLPEVDPASRADAARHPVLPRGRIDENPRRAAALLAREPRRIAAELPLPAPLDAVPELRLPPEARKAPAAPRAVVERPPVRLERCRLRIELPREPRRSRCGTGPVSFGELVDRFGEFPLLEFTGDSKETLALDGQSEADGWARLTWDGLTALQEYAAAAVRGEAGGDFKQWCEHTPPGCHRFPPRKAVRGESRTVASHGKWKRQRMLPVPAAVDASCRAFMGAHLRIGGGGTAPRVHYLDDCSGSGRIYVGYIGLHLTNTRTN
ncbi:hypothetical protein [Kitasatospora phosalacinea]|uniref:hypothetical protein n=1 Tax=Kitasatospora phosalacinea TaxID=2065 RepID=UPI00068F300E|nr:hypothetical protein [Kitasatospora phosalacinea]